MQKVTILFFSSVIISAQLYAASAKAKRPAVMPGGAVPLNHSWSGSGSLTPPSSDAPGAIAQRYLSSIAAEHGLSPADLASVYLVKEYRSAHNGLTHLVFRQQYDGLDVHGSELTINIDAEGQVINSGGRLYPPPAVTPPSVEAATAAVRSAIRAVNPSADSSYLPEKTALAKGRKTMKFVRGGFAESIEGQPLWFPAGNELRAAWSFFVPDSGGFMHYRTIVDSEKQTVLKSTRLGAFQAPHPPRGLIFADTPQPNPRAGAVTGVRPYTQRVLVSFTGDPQASPRGWVDGTETSGNNTVTGINSVGSRTFTPETAKSTTRDFSFPLEIGPGAPTPTAFKEAAATNLFYWINRTHDFLWHMGFDEAAGNFQQDNLGRGGVGGDPIYAYSQFAIARPGTALIDNSSFSFWNSSEDGFPGYVRMYLSGDHDNNIFADGSYDAGVIIHEYTHGVTGRLGRDVYDTYQGRAMGEAWSDYVALEMTLPEGARPEGSYFLGEYLFQSFGSGIRSRPYSTDLSLNGLTFGDYGRVTDIGLEEHFDGEIWFQALWEARANFMRMFGEKEGRRRMQINVIEGLKLQPPRASMIDARDAIILANRVTFKAEGEQQLWEGFAKRGLGVLAQSKTGDSSYVVPSFEAPSNTGVLRFHSPSYVPGETVRLVMYDANNTSPTALVQLTTSNGDLEHVTLRRRGTLYEGSILSANDAYVAHRDEYLDTVPSDFISAYYVDANTGSGRPQLVQATVPIQPEYTFTQQRNASSNVSGTERTLFTVPPGSRTFLEYAKANLPFEFRFFNRAYRSIYVSANGVITFGGPNPTSCNDSDSVASVPAIAPMWTELVYGGGAQANENVYYSTGPDSVTVRWAAETAYTGEPVNFSAVLYDDGRILYQYGAGNNNLVGTTILGCNSTTPVIGISAGRDSYQLRYPDYDGLPYLERAPSVLIDPPFNTPSEPVVRIETPEPDGSYSGVLSVRGIAYDPQVRITRLDLLIDGTARGMIQINQFRSDVCNGEQLPGCPLIGFLRQVDLTAFNLKPGTHSLQIRATNSRGAFTTYPAQPVTFNFEGSHGRQPVAAIETPVEGAALSATTPIRGYAYAADLRITTVAVLIDGINYGTAQYGLRRDDICGSLPNRPPNCPGVGFQFSLNTARGPVQLPNGKHTLQIRITDESGRFTTLPEQPVTILIENTENAVARGQITSPTPNAKVSGTVKVTGWAYDPDGTIQSVDFVVGLRVVKTLQYGVPSPDACAALPDVAACPNIGFEGDFDTTLLPNGQHLLYVRVRDNQGRLLQLPDPTYVGMTITIEN